MHGTSRPCLRRTVERATHGCCRVGRANNSNAFAQFFEQESQRYLTFTMIRTPSSYGRARGVSNFNMMMGMETRSTTGSSWSEIILTFSNSNVSMRVFGSTGRAPVGASWSCHSLWLEQWEGAPAKRTVRITSAPPAWRLARAAGKCLVGQQPSESGGALDERGAH
ncbi:NADH-quinone oxidoreductase protein [Cinnamomum micranthum f. kanehirae]|uniref:NADH-quinone oxidoreductase protein n=1 Tax=Cinnamomum micranthum f. kanehirae TaxID=337451 RepID=A0A3S4Q392_9MAGN|nr:NADH-quinone oxidoreductase protein [Cinnamomum micranthum f. kanehirae]